MPDFTDLITQAKQMRRTQTTKNACLSVFVCDFGGCGAQGAKRPEGTKKY